MSSTIDCRVVTLRSGAVIHETFCQSTMLVIRNLAIKNFTALTELFKKCKDDNYHFSSNSLEILLKCYLINNSERVFAEVKDIVLNAVIENEEGIPIKLMNPRV